MDCRNTSNATRSREKEGASEITSFQPDTDNNLVLANKESTMCMKDSDLRIHEHPVLGPIEPRKKTYIFVDGRKTPAYEGEPIAAALMAQAIKVFRTTRQYKEPRGVFCAIGRCTDCVMTVNGQPNIRTCVTPVEEGMNVETQEGSGQWNKNI